ncbi:hypothetical protein PPERSA_02306 [Pseudocohnilembus persalinus]|uniref:Uncharacterized protein n=1 Tax=Pseudocohnilembus persalinus TaxID=266149 RepID=A0A0V0QU38_PSEPJ|nr:hypothetical protein PPERSA_02306 [Pseudocohnilembus persalinus]|eukprot:KRX05774.1 hypothetical protein PPERSA_02306 [Pseudocohnilembus persalinus]
MGNSGYFGKTSSELNKSFNNSPSKFQKFKLMTHVQLKSNVDSVVNDFISKRYHNSPLRPSSTGANSFLINWNKVSNVQQGQKSPAKQALESAYSKQQMKKQSLEKEGSFFKKGLVNDLFESPFKKTSKYDLSNQQQKRLAQLLG